MNKDEILAMKPGRELDALVAEKVLGCLISWVNYNQAVFCACDDHSHDTGELGYNTLKHYSTDISAAWEIVEKINLKMYEGSVSIIRSAAGNPEYKYDFLINRQVYGKSGYAWQDEESKTIYANGQTAPEAICKAALLAVMV